MNNKTYQRQQAMRNTFIQLRSVHELCRLLRVNQRELMLLTKQPRYKSFSIPKKDGGQRHIETPATNLKKVQVALNKYLQAVYYFEKSNAAYGFIVGVRNEDDRRNVFTNAKKHLGREWLLNVDLKDFFHHVRKDKVIAIFKRAPFHFTDDLPATLAKICVYQGRLPMGAPTSPVVSNFACQEMDEVLIQHSDTLKWIYTRYADDMSFSSHEEITEEQIKAIEEKIQTAGFKVNPKKIKLYKPEEEKVVTGLLLADKVRLAPGYLDLLDQDLRQLEEVMRLQNFQGELKTRWVEKFRQQVYGRLNFAGFVLGRKNKQFRDLKDRFYKAINPPEEEFGAVNWRSFPYNF